MENLFLPDHPDSAAEYAHLGETCDLIDREIVELEQETGAKAGEHGDVRVIEDPTVDDETSLFLFRIKLDRLRQLGMSAGQAYFARLDYIPDGEDQVTYYLGRWGVLEPDTLEPVVVDWRSPVANLYYAGQPGRVDYETPDGHVTGDLTLKRMLTVSGRELQGIFDTDIATKDAYLQSVLGSATSDRLKEIVTTIQAEQNIVIRHPLQKDLLVQGVAGSGKTTIALHRIAYLLYTFRNVLNPERMMILAPTPMFLSYISAVLPDLGVERVIQTTFVRWCEQVMGNQGLKVRTADHMANRLTLTEREQLAEQQCLRLKGSTEMMDRADRFLEEYQTEIIPTEGLVLSGVRLYTKEDLEVIMLKQLKHFPLAKRINELKKYVRKRLNDVCEQIRSNVMRNVDARMDRLLGSMPDSEERRFRVGRLLDARDQQLKAMEQLATDYMDHFTELFPSMKMRDIYRTFLQRCPEQDLLAGTLEELEKDRIGTEDLAIVCHLCEGIRGLKKNALKHIVIDECQDFSPYQLKLLKRIYPAATITAVGDLTQGIREDEGTRNWQEWMEPVFGGEAAFAQLVTSYRNTVEIMEEAAKVAARFPIPGVERARPVIRHGAPVERSLYRTESERNRIIAETVDKWQKDGYRNMALTVKTPKEAAELYKSLKKILPVNLITEKNENYAGGLLIIPATLIKGMEFDCVLIADASADVFPDDEYLSRVLYVMMTRPLHCLKLMAEKEFSPMVGGIATSSRS